MYLFGYYKSIRRLCYANLVKILVVLILGIKIFIAYIKKISEFWSELAIFLSQYKNYAFLTLSTIALNAAGLLSARSARTLRLISIPALWISPINFE